MSKFEIGRAYFAIHAIPDAPKKIMICVGRDGRRVVLAPVGERLYKPDVMVMCNREVVQVKSNSGVYTVSSCSIAPLVEAQNVMDAMGGDL